MFRENSARLEHLRRMTDALGLIRCARGDCPDRFSGYDSIDNADALRLCATISDTVAGEAGASLARVYFNFLLHGRCLDGRVNHGCDALGRWHQEGDDRLVQSRLARALAAVMVSELPIRMRLAAADWWRDLLPQADPPWSPSAAANWLMALGQLRQADPGRDVARAESLARWLVEDCYCPTRTSGWEWFTTQWTAEGATIAAGLWSACELVDESRFAPIARITSQFITDGIFESGVCMPVGTCGGWSRGGAKAAFSQLPAEVSSTVEMLCAAEAVTGSAVYGSFIESAAQWFEGRNAHGRCMIDPESGGVHDALTADGVGADQGAAASVAYLLAHAVLSRRTIHAHRLSRDGAVLRGSGIGS